MCAATAQSAQASNHPVRSGIGVVLFIVATALATTSLGLVIVLYWRAQQAEEQLTPLQAKVTGLDESVKQERSLREQATAEADVARTKMREYAALADKITTLQDDLERQRLLVASKDNELSQKTAELLKSSDEQGRLRADASRAIQQLIVTRERLATAEQKNVEYLRRNRELQANIAAIQRGANDGWRPGRSPVLTPPPQFANRATVFCPPQPFCLSPGEQVICSTDWYPIPPP